MGEGEDGSIHGRVEKVSEDEKGGIGNNTRCCVGQVGGYFLFGCLRLSFTHTNNNKKMAPVWYCTVGTVQYTYMKGANIIKYRKRQES